MYVLQILDIEIFLINKYIFLTKYFITKVLNINFFVIDSFLIVSI